MESNHRRFASRAGRAVRRRWWIVVLVALLAVVWLGHGTVGHFTGAAFIEKRLSSQIASADGVNRIRIGSSNYSPLRGSFVARDIEFVPDTLLIAQRARAGTPPRTRYTITASSLRVHGIRFWPLLRGRIEADSVAIDGARVDIDLDRTVGAVPLVLPAILPQASLRAMARPMRIGVIRVTNTDFGYSEKAVDGSRPGTIRFTELSATVYNVSNDSTRMASSSPCTIDLRTRIAGAGQLDANFVYDFRPSRVSMTYRGTVSRMHAEPLNELLVNLNGIHITSGVIDSTWFDFTVTEDVASGRMQVLYQDFNFEMVDKVTLGRGAGNRLQTFIGNKIKVDHENPGDDKTAPRIAAVLRERPPESPLVKFLWETLRQGILSTLGL